MLKIKAKNKIYIVIAFFLFAVVFLIVFLIYPTFKSIRNGTEEILSNKNKIVMLNTEITRLDGFKEKYKNYKPNLDKIDNLFINSDNPVDFIKFLEKLAKDNNIDVDINLESSRQGAIDDFLAVLFQINAKGYFPDILKFTEKIERSFYIIRIENLTIRKQEKTVQIENNDYVESSFLIGIAKK